MLYLNEELKKFFSKSDPYEVLKKLNGIVYRQVETRKTFRFEHNGKSYFAKLHTGVGWMEIIKNLIQFKKPVLGARDEWTAISYLKKIPVSTMTVVAYGEQGWNPAKLESNAPSVTVCVPEPPLTVIFGLEASSSFCASC